MTQPLAQPLQQRPIERPHRLAQLPRRQQRVGQGQTLARHGAAQRHARGEALQVGDPRQARGHLLEDGARAGQLVDGVVAVEDRLAALQRPRDPLAQRARAHRRARGVDHAPQRRARMARVARVEHLEVGQRGRVELQEFRVVVDAQRAHVVERPLVAGRGVAQRRPRRPHPRVVLFQPEAAQRLRAEVARQVVVRAGRVEHGWLDRRHRNGERKS